MWIAKSRYNGATYGNAYNSIYDCQIFIDEELKEESNKHRELRAKKIFKENYKRKPTSRIDEMIVLMIEHNLCNGILCWNIEQERYCNSFDF